MKAKHLAHCTIHTHTHTHTYIFSFYGCHSAVLGAWGHCISAGLPCQAVKCSGVHRVILVVIPSGECRPPAQPLVSDAKDEVQGCACYVLNHRSEPQKNCLKNKKISIFTIYYLIVTDDANPTIYVKMFFIIYQNVQCINLFTIPGGTQ